MLSIKKSKLVENVVLIIKCLSRYSYEFSVEKGDYKEICDRIEKDMLRFGNEEFFNCLEIKNRYGIKEGKIIRMWRKDSFIVVRLVDIINLKEVNEELLNGWELYDIENRIGWKEIKRRMVEL
jgi:hypothetical protein